MPTKAKAPVNRANTTPLGSWGTSRVSRRYDRAAIKLAERTGMTLPVAS